MANQKIFFAILFIVLTLVAISGCALNSRQLHSQVLNISVNTEWKCNGKTYSTDELVIPIRSVTLPVDTSDEAYQIARQTIEYCNFNIYLDNASITSKKYSKTWFIRYFGELGRGELSVSETTGNIHRLSLVQPV